jgi:hypothetical protein
MSWIENLCMVAALLMGLAGLFVLLALGDRPRSQRLEALYRQFAQRLNGVVTQGRWLFLREWAVSFAHGGTQVWLDESTLYWDAEGAMGTRLTFALPRPASVYCHVRPRRRPARRGALSGRQQPAPGRQSFGDRFVVKTNDEQEAGLVLTGRVQEALLELADLKPQLQRTTGAVHMILGEASLRIWVTPALESLEDLVLFYESVLSSDCARTEAWPGTGIDVERRWRPI